MYSDCECTRTLYPCTVPEPSYATIPQAHVCNYRLKTNEQDMEAQVRLAIHDILRYAPSIPACTSFGVTDQTVQSPWIAFTTYDSTHLRGFRRHSIPQLSIMHYALLDSPQTRCRKRIYPKTPNHSTVLTPKPDCYC